MTIRTQGIGVVEKINNRVQVLAFCLGLLIGGLPAYAATAGGYSGHQAIAGDFNGDGWTDLLLQPLSGYDNVSELIAYPDGNFGSPLATWNQKSGGTDWNADAHRLVVGNFNGDDRDDVLLQGAAGLPSKIAYSRPSGSVEQTDYKLPSTLGGLGVSQASHHLVVGDFNGDGRDDLLLQANTFTGKNGIALATASGEFKALASKWPNGYLGLSWSLDRAAIASGDFNGKGKDELLVRSDSATGATRCCAIVGLGPQLKPVRIEQRWPAKYLGVDWSPSTHLAIVGDFNGDGRDDVLLQPMAAGGSLDVVLSNVAGHLSVVSDQWNGDRNGVDWSAQSYRLVPENASPGEGASLLMVPKQSGLPYRRAQFNAHGRLQSVTRITPPAADVFAKSSATGAGGASSSSGLSGQQMMMTNTAATANDNTVGAVNGQASVNNGTAGYSVKVAVPPGRAGMQPSLNLSYSSNGGDGHEGVGWSLGGFSSIYRCPATQASDGYTAGTTFSGRDRFCLDGEKLILSSGVYGQGGSIYHTEVNGFAKIEAHGSLGQGPEYFTVQTAGGRELYYGWGQDSRLSDNSTSDSTSVFSWGISRSVDLNGNEIDYHYTNNANAGEYYPKEIDYTLGNGSSASSERKIIFFWEPRTELGAGAIVHYLAGMKQSTTQLLTKIETQVAGSEVRDYTLSYTLSPATSRPLVSSIQTCAYVNGVQSCFKPTKFTYQAQHAPQMVSVPATTLGLYASSGGELNRGCGLSAAVPWMTAHDVNGDGFVDLLSAFPQTNAKTQYKMQYGKSIGFHAPGPPLSTNAPLQKLVRHTPIDFNLDGRTDSVLPVYPAMASGPTAIDLVYFKNGTDFTEQASGIELPARLNSNAGTYQPTYDGVKVGDVNGDGKPDLIVDVNPSTGVHKLEVYLAEGTGDSTHYPSKPSFSYTMPSTNNYVDAKVLDYDGDGRTDMLVAYKGGSHYTLLHSTGSAFESETTTIPLTSAPNIKGQKIGITIADINGDSLPDVLVPVHNSTLGYWEWTIYPNTGDIHNPFGTPIDTGIQAPMTSQYGSYLLYNFVKTLHDPDGGTDLVFPTARTYFAHDYKECIDSGDGSASSCPRSVSNFGECNYNHDLSDFRLGAGSYKDPWPQEKDGYSWTMYRAHGGSFNLSSMGQVTHNLSPGPNVDFNNDGMPDMLGVRVWAAGPATSDVPVHYTVDAYKLDFSGNSAQGAAQSPMPDLMKSSTNGLGEVAQFAYKPLTASTTLYQRGNNDATTYPGMLFSSPMQVVASMSQSNPTGGNNVIDYTYKDARYNVAGRGFEGFSSITSTNVARGLTTKTQYLQTFPFTGRVSRIETFVTGESTPFGVTTHDWQSITYGTAHTHFYTVADHQSLTTSSDPTSTAAPYTSATGSFTLISQSSSEQAVSTSNIDACGNALETTSSTITQQATRTVTTDSTFNGGNRNACWKDTLAKQNVTTAVRYTSAPQTSATLTTHAAYQYDPTHYWELTGKDVTSTHNGDAERKTTYGYDTYGNRTSVTRHDVGAGTSRTTTSDYSGYDGYFPGSITNAAGQTSTAAYDPATGNKTEVKDSEGHWTQYAYDPFGRALGSWSEGESKVTEQYLNAGASGISCPARSANDLNDTAYVLEKTQPGRPTTYSCFDAQGDLLRKVTETFSGGWVAIDSRYDDLGQRRVQTVPHLLGRAAFTGSTMHYDVLGRLIETVTPTEQGTRTIDRNYTGLTIAYKDTDNATGVEHDYTRYYDELGKGNGHLVQDDQVTQNNAIYTATYRYDAGGNLVSATDPAGHAIKATYDGFGDKLTLDDPDKGNSSYTYDGYGEEKTETNAAGQTITTHYDELGRPVEVDDPADNRVVNTTYDKAPNGVGQPATETVSKNGSVVYTRHYGYDTAGRQKDSEITTGGHSYLQGVSYDSDGRVNQKIYPALAGGASTAGPAVSASVSPTGPVGLNTTVTLQARASDPNGDWSLSYQWQEMDGLGATLSDPISASPTVTLTKAGTYTFRVTVSDGFKTAQASVSIVAETPPSGTETPSVSPNPSYTGGYTVSWAGNLSGATGYKLEQSFDSGAWGTVYSGTAHSKGFSGKAVGSYRYRVSGCNAVGCGSAGPTVTELVKTPPSGGPPLLSPNPSANGAFSVSWSSEAGAGTYQLEESANGARWHTVQNTGSRSWRASGYGDGTYRYRVRACNSVTGCGSWSATATETVLWPPSTAPSLTVPSSVASKSSFTVSWGSVSGATTYRLEQKRDGGSWLPAVDRQAIFSYTRTALFVDGSYSYQVQACNSAGCGPWSGVKTATVAGGGGVGGIRYAVRATSTTQTASTNESGGTAALVVQTSYTASGYPETLTRESDGYVYQHIVATNKWGQATLAYEGGANSSTAAVIITRADDPSTGLLTSLTAENPQTNATLAQVTSSWDGFGNLTSRKAGGSMETATYDKLNRLIGSITTLTGGGGSVTRSYSYDSTGNRTQACDDTSCTGFSYDGMGVGTNGAGPHAVTAVTLPGGTVHGSSYYAYNAMGEMTKDNDRTLTWNAFGKAESISQRQTTVNFSYGPGGSRYRKVVTGPASETVTYLGGAEVLDVGGNTSIRRTLGLAGLSVIDTGGANAGVHFGIPDHLGSMMALIDSSGSVTQGLSYGDFGKRYTTGWGGVLSYSQGWAVNTTLTDKGYTGQESLDSVGLDDYNARLYDPTLGRFLSTDPLISHPGSTQSINPYSYVENNPLNKTDPTGEASEVGRCSLSSSCVTTNSVTIVGRGGSTSIGSGGPSTDKTKKTSSTVAKAKRIEGAIAYGKKLANKRNTISSNASFNPNTHSQSSGSSGAGSPTTDSKNYRLYLVAELPHKGSPEGHVFIGGRTPTGKLMAYGNYPLKAFRNWHLVAGRTVPGKVHNNITLFREALSGNKLFDMSSRAVNKQAFDQAMFYIQRYARRYGYNLYLHSCVEAAWGAWRRAGLTNHSIAPGTTPFEIYKYNKGEEALPWYLQHP